MVFAVPHLPAPSRRPRGQAARPHGVGPVVCALSLRRSDGGSGRLPRGSSRERGSPSPPRGFGTDLLRPLVRPDGRIPRLRRDDRAQPSARARARGRFRGRDGGRLPPRHVRPCRPDAPASLRSRLLGCSRVAWRAIGRRQGSVLVVFARRIDGEGHLPPRRLLDRCRAGQRRKSARAASRSLRGRELGLLRRNGRLCPVPQRG